VTWPNGKKKPKTRHATDLTCVGAWYGAFFAARQWGWSCPRDLPRANPRNGAGSFPIACLRVQWANCKPHDIVAKPIEANDIEPSRVEPPTSSEKE